MDAPATLVVKADPRSIKQARDFVALAFGAWGLEDHVARTVVSELATNAIEHGSEPGDPVTIRVHRRTGGRVVIEAWDGSDAPPVVQEPDFVSEDGRGLFLLQLLVPRWGHRALDGGGKVVFAEIEPVPVDGGR